MAAADKKEGKSPTKSEIIAGLAEASELTKKDIEKVLEALTEMIKKTVGKKGPGMLTLPGLIKIRRVVKPATKKKKGRNPFTGAEIEIPAKPARTSVKVSALKALKDMVN